MRGREVKDPRPRVPGEWSEAERDPGPSAILAKRNFVTDAAFRVPLGPGSSLAHASRVLPDLRILECRSRVNPRSVRSLVRDTRAELATRAGASQGRLPVKASFDTVPPSPQ